NLLFLALMRKVLGLMLFAAPVNIRIGKVKPGTAAGCFASATGVSHIAPPWRDRQTETPRTKARRKMALLRFCVITLLR
ncbi:hypothetical protein, partial [Klebsiella michiganensis]|uniref:hypothetical protein n=1 Tax=Klebsiella michiganensis TaxID=1134687 RepID=UPI001D0F0863